MSQLAGTPVRLQFMRWDEHGWDNYGPAQHDGHPRRRRREAARSSRSSSPHFGIPALRPTHDPTTQQVGHAARRAGRRARSTRRLSGTQYNIPNRRVIGKIAAAAEQLLQDVVAAGAAGAADGFAVGADDRRARLRGEDGSGRVPAPEHRNDATDRTHRVAERARRRREGSRTGSRRSPPRTSRAPTSSPAAASRSAATPSTHGGRRRRHRGEQEDRQDHRQARCTSRRTPASSSTRAASRTR